MGYRDPRNLLILLGFLCQGFSWELEYMPIIFAIIWVICLGVKHHKPMISQHGEAFLLFASFFGFKMMSNVLGFGYTNLMFLGGNVLIVYQVIHLLGPPNSLRQVRLSVLVAIMHLGVGTQFIFDYKAFAILVVAIFLIPRAFYAVETYHFSQDLTRKHPERSFLEVVVLCCLMILFFVGFPRFGFQARAAQQLIGAQNRGPLSDEVDMARSGGTGSNQLVLRIEGEDIGYLKCFALDKFDGTKWSASHWLKKMERQFNPSEMDRSLYRSVRVFNYRTLGNCLPVDGFVRNLKMTYPDRPFIAGDGSVKVGFNLRNNFSYVYWTMGSMWEKKLSDRERKRYLEIPPQSQEFTDWLNTLLDEEDSQEEQARKLATFFRSEFKYNIGAPNLNRINPLDEFILKEREGHCERFASAMAVLLRLKGIPARVCVGFLPTENNELGEFYNVRNKHAHAWTEAYFQNRGWRIIDVTPYGSSVELERRSIAFTFFEWIEYIWYAKVVEFGVYEQREIFTFVSKKVRYIAAKIFSIFPIIFSLFACAIVVLLMVKLNWKKLLQLIKRTQKREVEAKRARHFYSRMIKALAARNYIKRSHQTPFEFLNVLEKEKHPLLKEIKFVTDCFCDIRYGHIEVSSDGLKQVKNALYKILKSSD